MAVAASIIVHVQVLDISPIDGLSECCLTPSLLRVVFTRLAHPADGECRSVPQGLVRFVTCSDCGRRQL